MHWFTSRVRRFWQWVSRLPKKVTIPVTVIVLILISLGSWQAVRFYNYTQEDPEFCRSCHIMEESWDRWATSEHQKVGCHSCHAQSLVDSTKLLINFVFKSPERVETHAVVSDDACEKCHESGNPRWIQVAATVGHKVHAEEENIACTKCHSVTLHRFEPPDAICSICHEEKQIKISGMASVHCITCHQYLAEEETLLPLRKSCLDCHQALAEEGVTWPADAPMQYPCADCHQPHQQAKPVVECLSCHRVEGLHLGGAHAGASQCQTCHQPHEWRVTQRDTCLSCHLDKTEHNVGMLCSNCHQFPGQ